MTFRGQQFVNISIKYRFPKYQVVRLVGDRDIYNGEECEIIGWAATCVKLRILGSNYWVTRAPNNLSAPYNYRQNYHHMPTLLRIYEP